MTAKRLILGGLAAVSTAAALLLGGVLTDGSAKEAASVPVASGIAATGSALIPQLQQEVRTNPTGVVGLGQDLHAVQGVDRLDEAELVAHLVLVANHAAGGADDPAENGLLEQVEPGLHPEDLLLEIVHVPLERAEPDRVGARLRAGRDRGLDRRRGSRGPRRCRRRRGHRCPAGGRRCRCRRGNAAGRGRATGCGSRRGGSSRLGRLSEGCATRKHER